jgi:site-specific DNA recombinase
MLAVIYVRVSTEEQARRGYSLPEQLAECRTRAGELGATELAEFVDDVGGDFLERPELEKARHLVATCRVHWFVCYDPDRFSRNLLNQLLVTDEIDKSGAELVFLQHNREKTPEGNLFYAIRGAIAEFEKKKILERTQRGKRGKAKQGLLPGYVHPYGYTMDTDQDLLVINELEAAWVKQIFAWASDPDPAARMGQRRIAERLNAMGVPAPRGRHWYRSTVAGILRNPLYTGVLRWGRFDHAGIYQARRAGAPRPKRVPRPEAQVVSLPVPPLVSQETFDSVQSYIQLDRHRRSRGAVYMLTGLAVCGRCGGRIQSKRSTYRYLVCTHRYPAYSDMSESRRAATVRCDLPHTQAERVEAFVWATVRGWMQDPEALRQALGRQVTPAAPQQPLLEERETIIRQIAELEQAQARILSLAGRTNIRPEIAEQQLTLMGSQIDSLARRQLAVEQALTAAPLTTLCTFADHGAKALAADIANRLDGLPETHRLHLVRRLVARVVIRGTCPEYWQVIPVSSRMSGFWT